MPLRQKSYTNYSETFISEAAPEFSSGEKGIILVIKKIGITASITTVKNILYPSQSLKRPETAPVTITDKFIIAEAKA